MKYKKQILYILLLFVAVVTLISSCSSHNVQGVEVTSFNAIQGYPNWWTEQKMSDSKKMYFYISSTGLNPYLVRLDAYDKLLSRIVEVLKNTEGIDERYRSELITTSRILDLSLEITNQSVYAFQNNTYECILLAECDTNTFYSESSVSLRDIETAYESIDTLRRSAKEAYRNNNDYESLNSYIQAALISENYPTIQGDNSFEELTYRAKRIVKNIYISTFGNDEKNGSCYVLIKRSTGMVHPRVKDAEIIATHYLLVSENQTETFKSDTRGIVDYKSNIRTEDKEDHVEFKLLLPSTIDLFKTEKGKAFSNELYKLRDANKIDFSFKRDNPLENKKIGAILILFNENDEIISNIEIEKAIINTLTENVDFNFEERSVDKTLLLQSSEYKNDEFDSLIYNTLNTCDYGVVLFGKVDDVNAISRSSERAVHTNGTLLFYDVKNRRIVFKNEDIDGVGVDKREMNAVKDAFKMCFDYATTSLQSFLYVDFVS